jgi:hypothetical protein
LKRVCGRLPAGTERRAGFIEGMFIVSDGVKGCAMDRPWGLPVTHLALVLLTLISLLAAFFSVPAARSAPQGTLESIVILYHSDVGGKVEPCG